MIVFLVVVGVVVVVGGDGGYRVCRVVMVVVSLMEAWMKITL